MFLLPSLSGTVRTYYTWVTEEEINQLLVGVVTTWNAALRITAFTVSIAAQWYC